MTPELTADSPGEVSKQIPSTAGMTTKVVKGSMWTLAGQVAPMAFSLIATPFVIRMLGSEAYGVLILVVLIPSYFSFADFGMSLASTKFGSEAYAEGNTEKEARVVRTAAFIALLASTPIAVLIFAFSYQIPAIFNVPDHSHSEAALALKFAAVTCVVNFLNGIFNTPQLSRLRMDLNTFVTAGFRILGIIATPLVLYLGYGIVGATSVLLFASILTLTSHIYISVRLLPNLRGLSVSRKSFRPLLKFGFGLVAASLAGILLVNAEKGTLSATVSPTALAYYSVAFTFASMLTMFSSAMVQSLLPAFSQLQGDAGHEQLSVLYNRGIKFNLIWVVPLFTLLIIVARQFFTIWAGPEFGRESTVPFYLMAGALALNILAYSPHTAIMASGRSDVIAKLYWLELIPYLILLFLFTRKFGITGAALAWAIRVGSDAILLFIVASRVTKLELGIAPTLPFLYASSVMLPPMILYFVLGISEFIVVPLVLGGTVIYAFILFGYVLEFEEVNWIKQRLNSLRNRLLRTVP